MAGSWAAGAVNRALGWAAGVPEPGVQSLPFQSIRCAGGSSVMPSHHTSPSSVRAQLVKMELADTLNMALGLVLRARARGHAEEPGLRVDGVQPAVRRRTSSSRCRRRRSRPSSREGWARAWPGWSCRTPTGRHRSRTWSRPRGGQLEDQHVLGQPAVVAGHDRGDAQGEALLAEQGVAAVARAVATRSRGSRGSGRCTCCRRRTATATSAWSAAASSSGYPTEWRQGTNSPSSPSTSRAPVPMRVMIRMLTAT